MALVVDFISPMIRVQHRLKMAFRGGRLLNSTEVPPLMLLNVIFLEQQAHGSFRVLQKLDGVGFTGNPMLLTICVKMLAWSHCK